MGVNSQPVSARRGIVALVCVLILLFSSLSARALIGVEYQMQLGNPSGVISDTNNHSHFLVQRTVEALDYNDSRGQPNWASWDLTASDLGMVNRSNYSTDTNLPPTFYRVRPGDYDNSGYDRGHLCPSKDRTDTPENNDLVFLLSNFLPQTSANNSGVWLQFENYCRSLAQSSTNYELPSRVAEAAIPARASIPTARCSFQITSGKLSLSFHRAAAWPPIASPRPIASSPSKSRTTTLQQTTGSSTSHQPTRFKSIPA